MQAPSIGFGIRHRLFAETAPAGAILPVEAGWDAPARHT
jgi:hypothetical protein